MSVSSRCSFKKALVLQASYLSSTGQIASWMLGVVDPQTSPQCTVTDPSHGFCVVSHVPRLAILQSRLMCSSYLVLMAEGKMKRLSFLFALKTSFPVSHSVSSPGIPLAGGNHMVKLKEKKNTFFSQGSTTNHVELPEIGLYT